MVPQEAVNPRIETRLNLVSKEILLLLGERGDVDLDGLGAMLKISESLAHLSVGWLARSRVVDLIEAASGKLHVRMRRPFE